MGSVAYEAARRLDGHPTPHPGEAPCPPVALLAIDRAVVFDHWRQRLILVAHVPAGGYDGGVAALEDLAERIAGAAMPPLATLDGVPATGEGESNMADDDYRGLVSSFKEHILAGDIYQGVPSRRVSFDAPEGGFDLPAPPSPTRRRTCSSSGCSAPGTGSSSRGRRRSRSCGEGRRVSTRPIAGTRPRGRTEVRDRLLEHELLADPKEQAEHAMLVDLARNDLGRVCVPGSVRPTELMQVERFSKVMHIVSTVEGDLREDRHPLDALAARSRPAP